MQGSESRPAEYNSGSITYFPAKLIYLFVPTIPYLANRDSNPYQW